jgi:hypothetical protein
MIPRFWMREAGPITPHSKDRDKGGVVRLDIMSLMLTIDGGRRLFGASSVPVTAPAGVAVGILYTPGRVVN